MQERTTLFINTVFGGGIHRWLRATNGGYQNALHDKCCSVCSSGSFGGVNYTFSTDSGGSNSTTCTGYTMRFLNDASFGFYCTFTNSNAAEPFDPLGIAASGSGFGSAPDYTTATFYHGSVIAFHTPQPPAAQPTDSDFLCFESGKADTMIASNAISQHSTNTAALGACIAAGYGSCGGVAYNPGVAASIQWSARSKGSTFYMLGVTFYAFIGCRLQLQTKGEEAVNVDETDPIYQASIFDAGQWWQAPYAAWLAAQALNTRSRRLGQWPGDMSDDHMTPSGARARILRKQKETVIYRDDRL